MKTRIIYTDFWRDNYISELSAKEKLAFIYLLTNDSVNICGIYQIPDKYVRMELDLSPKEWDDIKAKFINDGKFYFKNGWVKILNYEKFNSYTGEKNESAKNRELSVVPREMIEYQYSIDRVSATADSLNNQNQNQNQMGIVKGGEIQDLLTFFNKKANKEFRVTDDRVKKLAARRKKYSMDEIKIAADALLKSPFHTGQDPKNNPQNTWYATPDFLLRNDEKVDEWFNKNPNRKVAQYDPSTDELYQLIKKS